MVEKTPQRLNRRQALGFAVRVGAGFTAAALVGCGDAEKPNSPTTQPNMSHEFPNSNNLKPSAAEQALWSDAPFLPVPTSTETSQLYNQFVEKVGTTMVKLSQSENPAFIAAGHVYEQMLTNGLLAVNPVASDIHPIISVGVIYGQKTDRTGYALNMSLPDISDMNELEVALALVHSAQHIKDMTDAAAAARNDGVAEKDIALKVQSFLVNECVNVEARGFGVEAIAYMNQTFLKPDLNIEQQNTRAAEYTRVGFNPTSTGWKEAVSKYSPNCSR